MTHSLPSRVLAGLFTLAGLGPAAATASDSVDPLVDSYTQVAAPYELVTRNRAWNGDPHAMPRGRAELTSDGVTIWELADVTLAAASADGSTVALLTGDYQVHVSRLPEPPQRIAGGPYVGPALSGDGTLLVAQRLGEAGHILEKMQQTRGIALIDLASGEDRLLLEGNDLYAPSFASDRMVFFGSGGEEQVASLYLLDLESMTVARVTNREEGSRQTFPAEAAQLAAGTITYRSDGELYHVAMPPDHAFVAVHRFDTAELEAGEGVTPDYGSVRLRRPGTQTNAVPKVYNYFDLDLRVGPIEDYACGNWTYDQHQGIDFKQSYGMDVVAPAAGRVIYRYDGCPDTKQVGCGSGWGNHAALEHSDGSISMESHGKKWTVVDMGRWLACGDKVMESASSGNSNAYHIHHETWVDKTGKQNKNLRYEPYQGACDASDPSKWSTQNGYKGLPGDTCTH